MRASDGLIVVGRAVPLIGGYHAFVWDEISGMRDVKTVLIDFGLDLTGWSLTDATGISANGNTIVGFGINPDGNKEAWIATIPEPGTVMLLGIGGLIMRRRDQKGK